MNYDKVINNVPQETSDFLRKAIKIFSVLSEMNISIEYRCFDYNTGELKSSLASSNDIKVISLIAASLYSQCDCKEIFNKYGINLDKFLEFLGIDSLPLQDKISESDNRQIYDTYFSSLIKKTAVNPDNNKEKDIEDIFPELIITNCARNESGSSSILTSFLNYCETDFKNIKSSQIMNEISCSYQHKTSGKMSVINGLRHSKDENDFEIQEEDDKEPWNPYSNKFIHTSSKSRRERLTIEKYGELLNDREYKINPAVGRDEEIKHTIYALNTFREHPLLTGAPGVGKTAIVEGIAYRIKNGTISSDKLKNSKIYKMNIAGLNSGTRFRGDFEERVGDVFREAKEDRDIILFFDEIHSAIGAGASMESALDLANILKPYLDRESIKLIASTTDIEYDKYIATDAAFKRRFKRIKILEPNHKAIIAILNNLIPQLELYNHVVFGYSDKIREEILDYIVKSTDKTHRPWDDMVYNPDLAISILSEAFAIAEGDKLGKVTSKHIKEALLMCDRLNLSSRTESAGKLEMTLNLAKNRKSNILTFPLKNNKV